MMFSFSRALRGALVAAVLASTATGVSSAQDTMKMPPGMTPAIMKMMMTPGKPHPAGLPAAVAPVMGCIPAMGYHYANPKDQPFGPFYGYYNGKPIFTEIMVTRKAFNAGTSWDNVLKPLPGYSINHVDIWWEPHGHPGYLVPHYDIHAWYVPHAEHMKYCGNTSGTKPAFL
jgi:hypothetical protein